MSHLLGGHISRLKSGVLCRSSSVVHTTYLLTYMVYWKVKVTSSLTDIWQQLFDQ